MTTKLLGAQFDARIEGVRPLAAKTSYVLGNDPSAWRTGINNYEQVLYHGIYPGIDLLFHGTNRKLEYDFVVGPGAHPNAIRISFQGARRVSIGRAGQLRIVTSAGTLEQGRPKIYQERAGKLIAIAGGYRLRGRVAEFQLAEYDRRKALTIDPTLTYATYLGGSQVENQGKLALDQAGNAYVTGSTFSPDFPLSKTPAQATNAGATDVFVAKFNSSGALVYSTYIGGSAADTALGIAVDSAGNAYVTGFTTSNNFPTVNPFQSINKGGTLGLDAFVFKLNAAGTALVYSTYLGGNDDDFGFGIAVDSSNNAYVTGASFSLGFPVTPGAFQNFTPGVATFVSKFAATGQALVYSTLVGGNDVDIPSGIAVDFAGNAYVVGDTSSRDFPTTPSAYQRTNRGGATLGNDAFVYKVNPTGTGLVYCTLLGGSGDEIGRAIAIDATGAAYVTGRTASADFPTTPGALQSALSGPTDAFVAKLDPTGATLVFSTYFGGTRSDEGNAIALDSFNNVYLAGSSTSTNLPMVVPSQAMPGGNSDIFAVKLNLTGTAVVQSTYFGGTGDEFASGAALDNSGSLIVYGGSNSSSGVSTPGAFQSAYGGGNSDSLLAKFNFAIDLNGLTLTPTSFNFVANIGDTIPKQQLAITGLPGSKAGWTIDVTTATGGAWLNVTPRSGSGSGTADVTINSTGLALGSYSGSITLTNQTNSTKTAIPVTLTISIPSGRLTQGGVVNAASFQAGPLSPGLVVTLFGSNLGPPVLIGAQLDSSGRIATILSETRVLFDGVPAPLIYVSAAQVSAIVPYAVGTSATTQLQVEYKGVKSSAVSLSVAVASPAIFTADSSGQGQGAILNQDSSYNSAANPAAKNSIVVLYLTGEGQTTPAGIDGQLAADVFPKSNLRVTALIGGAPAEIVYAGAAPGLTAGVMQVNVRIPAEVQSGAIPVSVVVGAASSRLGVTVAVQ